MGAPALVVASPAVPARARLAFLALAAVIAVAAVVLLTRDPAGTTPAAQEPAGGTTQRNGSPSRDGGGTAPTEAPDPTPTPTAAPVLRAGEPTRIRVGQGDRVRFSVRHGAPEEIHLHGYDILREVGPGRPARVAFRATITGRFEIELHGSGEVVGELEVQPR